MVDSSAAHEACMECWRTAGHKRVRCGDGNGNGDDEGGTRSDSHGMQI